MIQLPEIRQLRVFISLEETRSFTAAANLLNITQSAVSHSLKSLEGLLGCQLIERLGKKCILTPHGEVFLFHAKKALLQLESATSKITTLNDWGYSSLRIGVSSTLCQYVMPGTLSKFYEKESRCEVFITIGDTADLIKKLESGELDFAFGLYSRFHSAIHPFVKLGEDKLCFITAPEHPWCKRVPERSEEYAKERFITYGNDTVTNHILTSHLSGIGIKQRATLAMGNMESIKEMVALNIGVGIISEWIAKRELEKGNLVKHEISPAPVREWGYYISKSKSLSLVEENFLTIFTENLERCLV
ncbi:MAG: LysR family transcriptional regulator [Akkermansiaceae bacterium]